jgi:tetratricopeptide (TPR) repeat protein
MTRMLDLTKDNQPVSHFIRWFCSPTEEQTIVPDSEVKNGTWVDNQILTIPRVSESFALEAFEAFPSRPLPEIAMAKFAQGAAGANFLRTLGVARLPRDCPICTKAGEMLRDQSQPERALVAANKALAADMSCLSAHRLKAACLDDLNRSDEAFQQYQLILARSDSSSDDFNQAGYLAARMGRSVDCNSIFVQATTRFQKDSDQYFYEGRAFMNLHRPSEAVTAFETSENLLPEGKKASSLLLAGQVAANWASGIKDRAVTAYLRLITESNKDFDWADSTAVAQLPWPDAEKRPLLEALIETVRQHTELVPDKKNSGQ